jgi:hypothetical protein
MDSYSPATISEADAAAILARVSRYVATHSGPLSEKPLSPEGRDDAAGEIVADWIGADWDALQWTYLERTGRSLFSPSLSEMGQHLRAALFMAGRCRKRGWRADSASGLRGAREARRRSPEEFKGASMASNAPSPDRVAEAIESASGRLMLSKDAAASRSKAGKPLTVSGGVRSVPRDEARKRVRVEKTRNTTEVTLEIVSRLPDRTVIRLEKAVRYNFRRVGSVSNRAMPKTLKRLPEGTKPDTLREALEG